MQETAVARKCRSCMVFEVWCGMEDDGGKLGSYKLGFDGKGKSLGLYPNESSASLQIYARSPINSFFRNWLMIDSNFNVWYKGTYVANTKQSPIITKNMTWNKKPK